MFLHNSQNALLFAEAAKSENISGFNIELCKEINVVHHRVQDFCKKCNALNLLDDERYCFFNATIPMTIINKLLEEIDELKEVVTKLTEYQVKFSSVAYQRRLYWYVYYKLRICSLKNYHKTG